MIEPQELRFKDDGKIPNNEELPVLLYKGVCKERPNKIEKLFNSHKWTNSWKGNVFDYHHYHSNTHEVLGVSSGSAVILLGGENGQKVTVETGDVAVLPAGTGHKRLEASDDFEVVGAYPYGVTPNKKLGLAGERPYVLEDIANVPMPPSDPVYGDSGPLLKKWTI